MPNQPKFQVRLSSNRKAVQIVNTRPENGARFVVVGRALRAEEAIRYAANLNRLDQQIKQRVK